MQHHYTYPDDTRPCPYCGLPCEADFVDIGVGYQQCGPYHCQGCGASEIGGYDEPRPLTGREKETGWYGPGEPAGSSVNTVDGVIVSHRVAKASYRAGKLDMKGDVPF
jgi:hypothetical protein